MFLHSSQKLLTLIVVAVLFLFPQMAFAEPASPKISNKTLLERIQKLEKSSKRQAMQHQMMLEQIKPKYPSLRMIGFTDISYSITDEPGKRSGFKEGQFVLHFSSALSERVSYFGEVSITPRKDAGTGDPTAAGFNVEIERSIIRFDQGNHLKVSFGRYHTPVNWWNMTFHHGAWLQTSIARPEIIKTFVPVHFLGASIEGDIPGGELNLYYLAAIGNGRAAVLSRAGDAGDVDNGKAWFLTLTSKPERFFGLQIGASVYGDKISKSDGSQFREIISAAHLVWNREKPEVIMEIANVHHEAVGGGSGKNHQATYIQLAYRLPVWGEQLKPYYRFDYTDIDKTDAAFDSLSLFHKISTVGLRYDLSDFAAIKFEYRHQKKRGRPEVNAGFTQVSFMF